MTGASIAVTQRRGRHDGAAIADAECSVHHDGVPRLSPTPSVQSTTTARLWPTPSVPSTTTGCRGYGRRVRSSAGCGQFNLLVFDLMCTGRSP